MKGSFSFLPLLEMKEEDEETRETSLYEGMYRSLRKKQLRYMLTSATATEKKRTAGADITNRMPTMELRAGGRPSVSVSKTEVYVHLKKCLLRRVER